MRLTFAIIMMIGLFGFGVTHTTAQGNEPGQVVESRFVTTVSRDQMDDVILQFYGSQDFVSASYAVDEYALTITTEDLDGAITQVAAHMWVPRLDQPLEAPIFVFGPGTTGLVDKCAATRENPGVADWGNFQSYLRSYAAQGFITIMADYVYFDDPDRLQPYYVSPLQGRVALDAARSVYSLFNGAPLPGSGQTTPFDAVFIGGYSQGGATVFAARDIQPEYAPDVPLAGILSFGTVADQKDHMLTRPEFSAYRWVAWEAFYGEDLVDLDVVFNELWLPTVRNDATRMCVHEVFNFYPKDPSRVYTEAFYNALVNDTIAGDFPIHSQLLDSNTPGLTERNTPVLILQGDLDETTPPADMEDYIRRFCTFPANTLTYNKYISTTHFYTRQKSYADTLRWMGNIVNSLVNGTDGELPFRDDCPRFRE